MTQPESMQADVEVLSRAIDQSQRLLAEVSSDQATGSTPCADWTVADLVDHIVAAPTRFARLARGEKVDWSAPTPPAGPDPAGAFRSAADELLTIVRTGASAVPIAWQAAELAVHTYDLATALGRPTGELDTEVAELGLTFMRTNLSADNRSPAFGPEQPAPDGANAYERIAAFAGRQV